MAERGNPLFQFRRLVTQSRDKGWACVWPCGWAIGPYHWWGINDAQCLLVIIGGMPEGRKELVGLIDGVRESAQSWKELLLDLMRRDY